MLKKLARLADELDGKGHIELANKINNVMMLIVQGAAIIAPSNPLGPVTDSNRMQDKNKLIQELLGMLQTQRSVSLPPVIADGNLTPQQIAEINRIAGKAGVGYRTYQELADKLLAEIRKKTPNALLTFRIPA